MLKTIETGLGRVKTERNGPRVIDLDILFYDNEVFTAGDREDAADERWLQVPHASVAEREFVLRPLVESVASSHFPVSLEL